MIGASTATRTSGPDSAPPPPETVMAEDGVIEIASAERCPQTKTSTVPKLRDVHRRAPCPSGLLRWRLLLFPGMMLKLLKVFQLNEVSTGSPFREARRWLCPPQGFSR